MHGRDSLTTSRTDSGRNTVSPEAFKAVMLLTKMTGHELFLFTQEVGVQSPNNETMLLVQAPIHLCLISGTKTPGQKKQSVISTTGYFSSTSDKQLTYEEAELSTS